MSLSVSSLLPFGRAKISSASSWIKFSRIFTSFHRRLSVRSSFTFVSLPRVGGEKIFMVFCRGIHLSVYIPTFSPLATRQNMPFSKISLPCRRLLQIKEG
ncbi:hypothetical protein U1Q18_052369 [Sarracenia purpurea var. burkii]